MNWMPARHGEPLAAQSMKAAPAGGHALADCASAIAAADAQPPGSRTSRAVKICGSARIDAGASASDPLSPVQRTPSPAASVVEPGAMTTQYEAPGVSAGQRAPPRGTCTHELGAVETRDEARRVAMGTGAPTCAG